MAAPSLRTPPWEIRRIEALAENLAVGIELSCETQRREERWTWEITGRKGAVIAQSPKHYNSPFAAMDAALERAAQGFKRQTTAIESAREQLRKMQR